MIFATQADTQRRNENTPQKHSIPVLLPGFSSLHAFRDVFDDIEKRAHALA
jgi:hypothetical protein